MGSTAAGRAFQPLSDPISQWSDRTFNGGARERKYAQDVADANVAAANKIIDDQKEAVATQEKVKERDLTKARVKAAGANVGGRSSTVLTGALGTPGAPDMTGTKTLLGQ